VSRKRLISPEFFTHGALYDAERASSLPLRIAFAGLWTVCDRRGLFRWRPRELKLAILPYDDVDFAAVLAALEAGGFVERYVVDGKEYGRVPTFGNWQTFHRNEQPSDIPEPSSADPPPANGRRESSNGRRNPPVTGTVAVTGTGTSAIPPTAADRARADASLAFDAIWPRYPKRAGGNSRLKARRAFVARVLEGVAPPEMAAGVERMAAFVRAAGKEGTEFVMQGATFFGPDEHWREPWDVPAVGKLGVAPAILGQAATLWQRYAAHQLLTRWPREEYERIGGELVKAGAYPSVPAFLDELRITQPWNLSGAKSDGAAINLIAARLSGPQRAAS
jgi:hypothetical protein